VADADVLFQEAHERRRRRHRRGMLAAALVLAVGAATVGFGLAARHKSPQHPASRPAGPPTAKQSNRLPQVAWVDYQHQVHIGSLQTHQQHVVSSDGGSPTTPLVVSGDTLFWVAPGAMSPEIMAYDELSGRLRPFAAGTQVFNATGSSDVFVADGNNSTIARYRLDGQLMQRFALPAGWFLPQADERGNAAPAVADGRILVQSQPPFQTQTSGSQPATLAVWTPTTGKVRPLGAISTTVATFTDSQGDNSLVVWLPETCRASNNCMLNLTDLATGTTKRIRSPLGYGFDNGGAFSPDGRQLAVFAKTNPGFSDPETRLALIDVTTGSLRLVPGATLAIGEALAWAQWLPRSGQVIVGGLQADHFLVDSSTLRSTSFSFLHDGNQDVNYSAVVLP
jgi:hypothetical protein